MNTLSKYCIFLGLMSSVLGGSMFLTAAVPQSDLAAEWELVGKNAYIENNSYFPIEISYTKNNVQETKYLGPDMGSGSEGPRLQLDDVDRIFGNINVRIAAPQAVQTAAEWYGWIKRILPYVLPTTINTILSVLPIELLANLGSKVYSITPQQFLAGQAIIHFIWPLPVAAAGTGAWILDLDTNSTQTAVINNIRFVFSKITSATGSAAIYVYDSFKNWFTNTLPNLIASNTVTATTPAQQIVAQLPEEVQQAIASPEEQLNREEWVQVPGTQPSQLPKTFEAEMSEFEIIQ